MKKLALIALTICSFAAVAQKRITVDEIVNGTFSPESVRGVNWMKDGGFYSALESNKVKKYDVTTGEEVAVLVDGDELGLSIDAYFFSGDETRVLLLTDRKSIYRRSFTGFYYAYDLENNKLLGKVSEERASYATFSPVDNQVAFVQNNNLFVTDLKGKTMSITTDGEYNKIINGSTDWVYEEELYLTKAFEWSPDGQHIAYYRFDESNVPEYNMQKWVDGSLYPQDYRYKYPKAGEANSKIEIWIHHLADGSRSKVDIGDEEDIYIPRIRWTKDATQLSIQRLNRWQNELDLLHAEASTGKSTIILSEKSDTYIDFTFTDNLTYLENGKEFLMSSERDGFKHFYLYDLKGNLINQITKGSWEAETMVGLDQKKRLLYYRSTKDSPQERHLYRVKLDGRGETKLSSLSGMHTLNMSPDTKYFMDYVSSSSKALSVSLYATNKNKLVKSLASNDNLENTAKDYGFSDKEFFTFDLPDGTSLDGYFLKPLDFNESNEYPVLLYQYSGPGSQNVQNNWRTNVWHQMLIQRGYIVAVIDPRGTGGKGERFKKMTYQELGKLESEDHIEAAKYLGSLSFVDKARIGIWGWSYGGYISSLTLFKGADYFKTAIAVAPVTSWRFYDTIYTERYLRRPQDNPGGYDDNSPLSHTKKLKGNFLLIHGTGDDNVHFANAVALQEQLIKDGKQFDSFYYPDLAHGLRGDGARKHLFQMMTDYIMENL